MLDTQTIKTDRMAVDGLVYEDDAYAVNADRAPIAPQDSQGMNFHRLGDDENFFMDIGGLPPNVMAVKIENGMMFFFIAPSSGAPVGWAGTTCLGVATNAAGMQAIIQSAWMLQAELDLAFALDEEQGQHPSAEPQRLELH